MEQFQVIKFRDAWVNGAKDKEQKIMCSKKPGSSSKRGFAKKFNRA